MTREGRAAGREALAGEGRQVRATEQRAKGSRLLGGQKGAKHSNYLNIIPGRDTLMASLPFLPHFNQLQEI